MTGPEDVTSWLTLFRQGGPLAVVMTLGAVFFVGLFREWWVWGGQHRLLLEQRQKTEDRQDAEIQRHCDTIIKLTRKVEELTAIAIQHASTIDKAVSVVERQRS
jgi:hypothetical protein